MSATAPDQVTSPIDETIQYHSDGRGSVRSDPSMGNVFMLDSEGPRRLSDRFAFGSGARPLDGFTIKRAIGRGGFGEVYYATSDSGREVALKLILRNLDVERRGVVQCMNLKHSNLLTIFDLKSNDAGDLFVVMEYVSGPSLADVLRRNPTGLPHDEVRRWLKGLIEGVVYLHDHGVVHRDLKPANLFMEEGVVKIGDYGLAKLITASHGGDHSESIGTCHYMAPEIGSGKYHKPIDVYALGVILYEMLTGRVPFDGETVNEILMKHLTARPDLMPLPENYRGIVARALAKDPAQRPTRLYDLMLPADAPKNPEIRIIGSNEGAGSRDVESDLNPEVHRIVDEEPIFYIGPETLPPMNGAAHRDQTAGDWRRMRSAAGPAPESRRTAQPSLFQRPGSVGASAGFARPAYHPPAPPPAATGRARIAEASGSMLWAALLTAVAVLPAAALLNIHLDAELPRVTFLYAVALTAIWTILVLNKSLEAIGFERFQRRIVAILVGATLGVGVLALARGLMIDPGAATSAPVYFAALFGATSGWYGQSVRDRKKRFRLLPVIGTLAVTLLLAPLWPGHGAEAAVVSLIIVSVVQLVSPWNESAARYTAFYKSQKQSRNQFRTA